MIKQREKKNVVTIAGGTGFFMTLSGLKKYPQDFIDITVIVNLFEE